MKIVLVKSNLKFFNQISVFQTWLLIWKMDTDIKVEEFTWIDKVTELSLFSWPTGTSFD